MRVLLRLNFNTFQHLIKPPHSLKYPGDQRKMEENLNYLLKAIQMQQAEVRSFQDRAASLMIQNQRGMCLVSVEQSPFKHLILLI